MNLWPVRSLIKVSAKQLAKKAKVIRKIKVDENGQTTISKVFAGGDIVNINLDAVTAIADAKVSAQGISLYFQNTKQNSKQQ